MRGRALVLLAIAGCWPEGDGAWSDLSDEECSPGNARPTGEGCIVPPGAVTVDGDSAEWSAIEEIPLDPECLAPPCDGLAPERLQLAMNGDGALTLLVRLGGAPLRDDPTIRYVVDFTANEQFPVPEVDRFLAGAGEQHWLKNRYVVDPPFPEQPPWRFQFTSDGFELSILPAFLPFPIGGKVAIYAIRDVGGAWQPVSDDRPLARACWNPSHGYTIGEDYVTDPCSLGDP